MSRFLFLIFILSAIAPLQAQYSTPVEYMNAFTSLDIEMANDYMSYLSAVAHGHRARKMEKRRKELLATVAEGRKKAMALPPYQGNNSLRQAYVDYVGLLHAVLNEDYGKIVNLEEIAEQSYDAMEAYLLAEDQANEKLRIASDTLHNSYRKFAADNHVRLIDSESKTSKKLEQAGRVNRYYNQIYLIYFKSSKQEIYLIDAMNKNDLNAFEQNRSSLSAVSAEGLQKLTTVKPFDGDYTLVIFARKLLELYKVEADQKLKIYPNLVLQKDQFDKFKKTYDEKPERTRTQADVNQYNKFVNDINKTTDTFNKANNEVNASRSKLTDAWQTAVEKFMDVHTPK